MDKAAKNTADADRLNSEFLALLGKYELDLAACVHVLVPSWQDAEDILQETKITLWKEFGKFRPGSDFLAWARTVARYAVRTHIKQSQRKPLVLRGEIGDILMSKFVKMRDQPNRRLEILVDCIKTLGNDAVELLRRCYVDKQKIKDIAAELGRSLAGTYAALSRTRRDLLNCMREKLRQEDAP